MGEHTDTFNGAAGDGEDHSIGFDPENISSLGPRNAGRELGSLQIPGHVWPVVEAEMLARSKHEEPSVGPLGILLGNIPTGEGVAESLANKFLWKGPATALARVAGMGGTFGAKMFQDVLHGIGDTTEAYKRTIDLVANSDDNPGFAHDTFSLWGREYQAWVDATGEGDPVVFHTLDDEERWTPSKEDPRRDSYFRDEYALAVDGIVAEAQNTGANYIAEHGEDAIPKRLTELAGDGPKSIETLVIADIKGKAPPLPPVPPPGYKEPEDHGLCHTDPKPNSLPCGGLN